MPGHLAGLSLMDRGSKCIKFCMQDFSIYDIISLPKLARMHLFPNNTRMHNFPCMHDLHLILSKIKACTYKINIHKCEISRILWVWTIVPRKKKKEYGLSFQYTQTNLTFRYHKDKFMSMYTYYIFYHILILLGI